jgi:hypothetical protein
MANYLDAFDPYAGRDLRYRYQTAGLWIGQTDEWRVDEVVHPSRLPASLPLSYLNPNPDPHLEREIDKAFGVTEELPESGEAPVAATPDHRQQGDIAAARQILDDLLDSGWQVEVIITKRTGLRVCLSSAATGERHWFLTESSPLAVTLAAALRELGLLPEI